MRDDPRMNSRVHPNYKTRYRVTNWSDYDRALVQRGGITMWIQADDTRANRVAKWDGTQWSALGSGLNGVGLSLGVFDNGTGPKLFAGGDFSAAGAQAANHIAMWDGTDWTALGSGLSDRVFTQIVFTHQGKEALFMGGAFREAPS